MDAKPIEVLIAAVRDAARDQILPRFRALSAGDVTTKAGPTDLVTVADTAAEAQIAARLARDWPGVTVLGEEGIAADPARAASFASGATLVIVDPVDGTWNFAKGLATFGVILAVAEAGRPVFSLLYDPLMDDWVTATRDGPAELITADGIRRTLSVSDQTDPARQTGYAPIGLFEKATQARLVTQIPAFSRLTSLRCSCHEYRMLAQGHVDWVMSGPVSHPWDHAAGVLAVQQAGGVARFLDGADYTVARSDGVVLSANCEATWAALADRFAYLA